MSAPRVVLVRPRNHDNLLSIAQAMKMFGLVDWVSVSAPVHHERLLGLARMQFAPEDFEAVSSLRCVGSIEEATRDCEVVVGTTMRESPGKPRLTTRELAEYQANTAAKWALVFGAETNGLTVDDVKSCNALSFIPTSPEQPSVNLSQAVVLFAYELQVAQRSERVDVSALRSLRDVIADVLRAHGMPRRGADDLMPPLLRAGLTKQELALFQRNDSV